MKQPLTLPQRFVAYFKKFVFLVLVGFLCLVMNSSTSFASTAPVTISGTLGVDNNLGDGGAGGAAVTTVDTLDVVGDSGVSSSYLVLGGKGGDATGMTGNGGAGGDAALTVSGTASTSSGDVTVIGGDGGTSAGGSGGNGGAASVSIGTMSIDNGTWNVLGGNGVTVGNASASASSLTMDSSLVRVSGTSASASLGSLSMNDTSYLLVMGGSAGTGSLTITGSMQLGNGIGPGTANVYGKDALAFVTSDISMVKSYLGVNGGQDGSGSLMAVSSVSMNGGGLNVFGGNTSMSTGSDLDVVDGASMNVSCGSAGSSSLRVGNDMQVGDEVLSGTVNVTGKDASVSVGSNLSVISRSAVNLTGGMDGVGSLAAIGGVSLNASSLNLWGGVASVSSSSFTASNASTLLVYAWDAGVASWTTSGSMAVDGSDVNVIGLNASVSADSLTMGNASILGVTAGNGGTASLSASGAVTLVDSSVNITGGNALVSASTLTVSDATTLNVVAGSVGMATLGTSGAVSMNAASLNMTGGTASVSIGSLVLVGGSDWREISQQAGSSLEASDSMSLDHSSVKLEGHTTASVSAVSLVLANGSVLNLSSNSGSSITASAISVTDSLVNVSGDTASVSIGQLTLSDPSSAFVVGSATNTSARLGGLFGSGSLTVTGGLSNLQITNGDFSGTINGAVGLEKVGDVSDTLVLNGHNIYSGATTVTGGTLAVDTFGTLGTSNSASIGTAGTLAFVHSSVAGGISIVNFGKTQFEDDATADQAGIDNFGEVWFEGHSTAGSATVVSRRGAGVYFDGSAQGDNSVFDQGVSSVFDISGSASGVTVGSLSGGGTILLGGLNLGVESRGDNVTLSGVIADGGLSGGTGGSLTKLGSGDLTLSGENTFSGGLVLQNGRLVVASGGALGSGSVMLNGGSLSADGGIHTIVVETNYLQKASAALNLRATGIHTAGDLLWVGETASLDGTLHITLNSSSPDIGDSFTVISAGSVTGRFASVTDDFSDRRFLAVYLPTSVMVETLPGSFKQLASSPNQASVAGALDGLFNDPSQASLMLRLSALTADEYPRVYESMNPSGLASIFTVQYRIAGLQSSALSGRMSDFLFKRNGFEDRTASIEDVRFAGTQSADEEMATATDEMSKTSSNLSERWGGFYCGDAGNLKVDGDGNGEGYKATFRGITAAGADFRVRPNLAVGFLFGYQDADVNTDGGSHVDIAGGQLGVYGLVKSHGFYAQALAEGGGSSYDSKRVSYGTAETGTMATGTTDGKLFSGQLGGGYQYTTGSWAMGPIASVQYTRLKMGAFQETGSLTPEFFPSQAEHSLSVRWGAQASGNFNLGRNLALIPILAGSWLEELHDKGGSVTSSIAGQVFTVDGSKIGQSDFRVDASLGIEWKKAANISVRYQKDLGCDNFDAQTVGVELRYKL